MKLVKLIQIYDLGVNKDFVRWARGRDIDDAWRACPGGDVLLLLAAMYGVERKLLVLAAADCAEATPQHKKIPTAVRTIRVTRALMRGKATDAQVHATVEAAFSAADAAEYGSSKPWDYATSYASDAASSVATLATCPRDRLVDFATDGPGYAALAIAANRLGPSDVPSHAAVERASRRLAVLIRRRIPWSVAKAACAVQWSGR